MAGRILFAAPIGALALFALVGADEPAARAPSAESAPMTVRFELFVADVEKSAAFYCDVLGFERMPGDASYLPIRNGSVVIGLGPAAGLSKKHYFNPELQTARRGLGAEIVLEVDDVEAAYQKAKASGYRGHFTPLAEQSWGLTDFRLADPDGYYLRITSR